MTVVVAFVSRKGGVGKSTLARALCAVAARRGLNTTLADLDDGQRTASRWQHLREQHGVFPPLNVARYGNVDSAIASEPDTDVLIVDGPGRDAELTMEIASVAHFVVQPTGACFDDLQPAAELFYELRASGIRSRAFTQRLSRVLDDAEEAAARAYLEVGDFNLLPGAVGEWSRYREAHNRGLAFIECPGEDLSAPAGALLGALLTRIIEKHKMLRQLPSRAREAQALLTMAAR